jgi:Ca-activated chloride channel homolog
MPNWVFANSEALWGLLIIPILIAWYTFRYWKEHSSLGYSTTQFLPKFGGFKTKLVHIPFVLRMLAIAGIVVSLARPQSSSSWQNVTTEGIDIILAIDISSSMLAQDFKPNRLEAAKEVAVEFIKSRPSDRIGLVIYSGESFTQCPLTTDHDKLINLFQNIKNGMITDGTAIGMGLANSVNRLKESDAKSKIVILLTDGENTAGSIPPITAAEIAATFGVKVYTVGVGTKGQAPIVVPDMFGRKTVQMMDVNIDEESLQEIADLTNGSYFRATDNDKLKSIYSEIDLMEKTIVEETQYEKKYEQFLPIALIAIGLLFLEFLIRKVYLKSAFTDV